ncbi:MAG TPA: carbohydrate ABC transporter substrate-binding protein [Treponemataceae bacterium]|jgi:hypothetical protein|nr:carbohydrate ABC transporter substrate-binding protein [Treponemataceae bacterium]
MRLSKKVLLVSLVLVLAAGMVFAGGSKDTAKKQGKVLTIYCWNDEFQTRFNDYFAAKGLVPDGIEVNWVITPNQGNAYQNKLDEALLRQNSASERDIIDIFLVEADYALRYVDTPFTLDVFKDVGLTSADVANQYKYTKDIMTDSKGVLKGVSWQACPGGFIYRRSIAKAVLGTDDPAKVQEALSSWDKFDAVAAQAKAKGYFMLSGFDDAFRVFSDNAKTPWVGAGDKIQIDANIERWIEQTKTYTDKGYNNKANLWSAESWAGGMKDGKVFGYFGPSWFQDFCLAPAVDTAGDWAVCTGPQGFSWGGTWICAAAGTDNIDLVKQVMLTLTTDKDTLVAIAQEAGDFTNHEGAMAEIAKSSYGNPFLGGQNHIAYLLESAKKIDRSSMGPYDQGMTETIQASFADYFNGSVTKGQAWDNFYKAIIELHPNLKK